ncbi:hypothetical protein JCM8097_000482 [Rhodosporidiobolus ruineniae]
MPVGTPFKRSASNQSILSDTADDSSPSPTSLTCVSTRSHTSKKCKNERGEDKDEKVTVARCQHHHATTTSAGLRNTTKPRVPTSGPTHDLDSNVLIEHFCKDCNHRFVRRATNSSTSSYNKHKDKYCKARKRERGQRTLGETGVEGTEEVTKALVEERFARWCAEQGRSYNITQDRLVSLLIRSLLAFLTPQRTTRAALDEEVGRWLFAQSLRPLLAPSVLKHVHKLFARNVSRAQQRLYILGRRHINARIKRMPGRVYLGMDCWTAPNGLDIVGFVLYGRDEDGSLVEIPFKCKYTPEAHNAPNLASLVIELIEVYELQDKIAGFVGDNASVNLAMIKILPKEKYLHFSGKTAFIRCWAHVLNLVTQAILSSFLNGSGQSLDEDEDDEPRSDSDGEDDDEDEDGCASSDTLAESATPDDEIILEDLDTVTTRDYTQLVETIRTRSRPDNVAAPSSSGPDLRRYRPETADDPYRTCDVNRALAKIQNLAVMLRKSTAKRKVWCVVAAQVGAGTERRVRRAVSTRWNSRSYQLQDVVALRDVVEAYQTNSRSETKNPQRLTAREFLLAEQLVDALKPITALTAAVSKARSARIGDVFRWIDDLSAAFDGILSTDAVYPAALMNAVNAGYDVLDEYYTRSDKCKFYSLGVALHPSMRMGYIRDAARWSKKMVDTVMKLLQREYRSYATTFRAEQPAPAPRQAASTTTTASRAPLAAYLASHASSASSPRDTDYLATFVDGTPVQTPEGEAVNPFDWWLSERRQGREWGGLVEMALDVFSAPVSSVAVERVFSFGRHVVSEKRHSLSASTLSATLTVGGWSKVGWLPDGLLENEGRWEKDESKLLCLASEREAVVEEEDDDIIIP